MIANQNSANTSSRDRWFDELLAALSTHKLMLDQNVADKELWDFYNTLIGGNIDTVAHQGKEMSQRYFISKIIVDYLSLLSQSENKPAKLAFDMNDTEVLVWAEVEDNNEAFEKQLILTEAKVNAKYHQYGYDMTSMIVEESDCLAVPNHYVEFHYKA